MQLRYFTALNDVASQQATTIVFPIPMDLIAQLGDRHRREDGDASGRPPQRAAPA